MCNKCALISLQEVTCTPCHSAALLSRHNRDASSPEPRIARVNKTETEPWGHGEIGPFESLLPQTPQAHTCCGKKTNNIYRLLVVQSSWCRRRLIHRGTVQHSPEPRHTDTSGWGWRLSSSHRLECRLGGGRGVVRRAKARLTSVEFFPPTDTGRRLWETLRSLVVGRRCRPVSGFVWPLACAQCISTQHHPEQGQFEQDVGGKPFGTKIDGRIRFGSSKTISDARRIPRPVARGWHPRAAPPCGACSCCASGPGPLRPTDGGCGHGNRDAAPCAAKCKSCIGDYAKLALGGRRAGHWRPHGHHADDYCEPHATGDRGGRAQA